MPIKRKPLVMVLADDRLHGAEVTDLSTRLKIRSFEEQRFTPATAEEHERNVARLRPAAVVLPRRPLNTTGRTLPFTPSRKAADLAPHFRFDYQLPRLGAERTRKLTPLRGARA